jgi:hypothetical protein
LTLNNSHIYNDLRVLEKLFNRLKGSDLRKQGKEKEPMDNEVRPTWRLAWGLWWRMFLISLGISVIIGGIIALVGLARIPWESLLGCLLGGL